MPISLWPTSSRVCILQLEIQTKSQLNKMKQYQQANYNPYSVPNWA
ncbi:hypothetical protein MtrunA17_Chr4g0028661 [Medicago truncatula]|uniref:Uncharacterized protein n=1 Tax=Medicago truncatula TaxID=3880 RepID=A0A396ID02_MEDTR|nr:hypothetical protein MtrunA17_Chr4g0028661 [Medicago truncatula]